MRIASMIFITFGMIVNFFASPILGIVGVAVGSIALATLASNKKNTAIGILSVIFAGMLGGIFYLCWNPTQINKGE